GVHLPMAFQSLHASFSTTGRFFRTYSLRNSFLESFSRLSMLPADRARASSVQIFSIPGSCILVSICFCCETVAMFTPDLELCGLDISEITLEQFYSLRHLPYHRRFFHDNHGILAPRRYGSR